MTTDRACPRDGEPLRRQTVGPAEVHLCSACRGLWIGGRDLEAFLRSPFEPWKLESMRPAGSTLPVVHETVRCLCTAGAEMGTLTRAGVVVDLCPDCGALWLDGGELEALLQKAGREPGEHKSLGVEDALNMLIEILGIFI